MDELFAHAAARLAEFPMIGRAGRVSGTREWVVHESYRVAHRDRDDIRNAIAAEDFKPS